MNTPSLHYHTTALPARSANCGCLPPILYAQLLNRRFIREGGGNVELMIMIAGEGAATPSLGRVQQNAVRCCAPDRQPLMPFTLRVITEIFAAARHA